jgi:two-component system, sensor histidine kinase PdtaS
MAAVPPLQSPIANKLALAMVAVSTAPLLLLDGDLKIIAASNSFSRAFDVDAAGAQGRELLKMGAGEWNMPKLRSFLQATLSAKSELDAYEIDLKRPGQEDRRLVLNAHRLEDLDAAAVSLLLTVSDVTEARIAEKLKDDMLREKAILLQEVQHRVANSLQIIASVLMQSARKVQSEETRAHLHDAHHRVMSIATVQQQLAASRLGDVELRPYFTQLCESLGASMIRDHNEQSIVVSSDDSKVAADISVSLGLIVTELVINALKHAFPGGRAGRITVDYQSRGPNWALSVGDNGIGMPAGPRQAKPGLGTSIVEALARQLNARVHVADAKPGTAVSVVHNQIAAVEEEPQEAAV